MKVWVADSGEGFQLHASEAGARDAAVEGWRAVKDTDDPDGPHQWETKDDRAQLVVPRTPQRLIYTGFQVYEAEVHTP